MKACGAKTRTGGACKRRAMPNGRCWNHGGATPAPGPNHPAWQSGRYSKFVGARLLAEHGQIQEDAELMQLRSEVLAVDARIADLLKDVEEGAAYTSAEFREAYEEVVESRGAAAKISDALNRLGTMLRKRSRADEAWVLVAREIDRRARLVMDEHRRRLELERTLTPTEVVDLAAGIVKIVERIPDAAIRQSTAREIAEFVAGWHSRGPETASGPATVH